jgi:Ran-binding protein 3
MTEPADNPFLNEANGLPVMAEKNTITSRPNSPLSGESDNDGAERPVREKLKKASIAGLSTHGKANDDKPNSDDAGADSSASEDTKDQNDTMVTDATSSSRGRPARKRSFDDLQNESMTSIDAAAQDDFNRAGGHHKRMRSRDMSSSKKAVANGKVDREQVQALAEEEDDVEAQKSPGGAGIMVEAPPVDVDEAEVSGNQSPKKKRSRDQFDKDDTVEADVVEKAGDGEVLLEGQEVKTDEGIPGTTTNSDKGEPEKKRHRDTSEEGREGPVPERAATTVGPLFSELGEL